MQNLKYCSFLIVNFTYCPVNSELRYFLRSHLMFNIVLPENIHRSGSNQLFKTHFRFENPLEILNEERNLFLNFNDKNSSSL